MAAEDQYETAFTAMLAAVAEQGQEYRYHNDAAFRYGLRQLTHVLAGVLHTAAEQGDVPLDPLLEVVRVQFRKHIETMLAVERSLSSFAALRPSALPTPMEPPC